MTTNQVSDLDIHKLTKLNGITIKDDYVNDFFSPLVLSTRLKGNLSIFVDLIISTYGLFHKCLLDQCISIKSYIENSNDNILFNTYFKCNDIKCTLLFYSNSDKNLNEQSEDISSLYIDNKTNYELLTVNDSNIPEVITNLVKMLNSHVIDKHSISLTKTYISDNKHTLFNQVNFPGNVEGHRGLSILIGFQY